MSEWTEMQPGPFESGPLLADGSCVVRGHGWQAVWTYANFAVLGLTPPEPPPPPVTVTVGTSTFTLTGAEADNAAAAFLNPPDVYGIPENRAWAKLAAAIREQREATDGDD